MRRLNLCASSLMTAGLLSVAAASPAAAADKRPIDVSASARVISIPSPSGAVPQDTTYAGLAETMVSVGLDTAGVPCAQCVPGAGGNNIGLPWPVFAIPQGATMSISTWFESTSYTGPCTAGLFVKQGSTVVASGSFPFPGGCQSGNLYGVFFTVPAPTTTGYTSVTGAITGGTNKSGAITFINVQ
jgi:hypothetical protein